MPKPTTTINPETPDVPFYFVRISSALFTAIEAQRLAMGYNKKKSVEVMAELFMHLKPAAGAAPTRMGKSKAKKPTKKKG